MRVVGARNIDVRQQKLLKPLNQLAATPAGLHTYSCMSSSSSSSSPGLGPQQGPTAVDFFTRYPQLHVFLLQQLNNAVQQQQQHREIAAGSSSTATVPPSLFPSLILLSRLRPLLLTNTAHPTGGIAAVGGVGVEASLAGPEGSAAAAGSAASPAGLDPSVFVPAVIAVGQSAVMGVRSMAAAALAPLVPAEQLHAVCLHLAACLPAAAAHARLPQHIAEPANGEDQLVITAAAAAAAGGGGGAGAIAGSGCGASVTQPANQVPLGQNALHGALLQLTALLAAVSSSTDMQHTGNSSSSSCLAAAALVQQLLPAFASSTGLMAAGSSTSCAVRQAYVAAAGQLLVLAYRHWPLLQQQARAEAPAGSRGCTDLQLLKQFVGSLQASCLAEVQSTVSTGATAAAATGGGCSNDAQDPLFSCWLRDSAALLMGPVLEMEVLLHSHDPADMQQHQPSSGAATSEQVNDMQVLNLHLQLLSEQLPGALQGSSYEVRAAALKACAVQLERLLLVCRGLQAAGQLPLADGSSSGGGSGSRSSSACLQVLSGCVWQALKQQQVVKVLKRLLAVWGLLQCLQLLLLPQGLLPVTQCGAALAAAGGVQGGLAAAAADQQASTGMAQCSGVDTEQLSVLLQMAGGCREPDASVNALLCAARVGHGIVSAHAPAAAAAAGPSSVQAHEFAALQGLRGLIDTFSKPHQPEQLREAAAEALVLSGLLLPLTQSADGQSTVPPGHSTPPAAPSAANQGSAGHSHAHEAPPASAGLQDAAAGGVQGVPAGTASIPGLPWLSLQAWFLAVRLMEDDDDDVRLEAAAAAQQALDLAPPGASVPLVDVLSSSSSSSSIASLAATTASTGCASTASDSAAPVTKEARGEDICAAASATAGQQYVAAVQYRCFGLLARCSSWYVDLLPDVVELLAQTIVPLDMAQPLVLQQQQQQSGSQLAGPSGADATASGPQQAGDCCVRLPGVLLRRLFEREADNHHEEPLLLAQHAAAALHHTLTHLQQQDLLRRPPSDSDHAAATAVGNAASGVAGNHAHPAVLDKVLGTWCSSIVRRFLPAVVPGVAAVGRGGGNATACTAGDMIHPEVFVPLYRCCLALWAARPWLQQGETASEPLLPCGGGVQGELWAEVCALLTQLMQAHPPQAVAAMVQAVSSQAEESAASHCAALFLLH